MKKQTSKQKTTKESRNGPSATAPVAPAALLVRIEFEHPTAHAVCIAGSFNDWHPSATEMVLLAACRT
jgi:hypothetical protein